ncbi:MAG TPA: hypothetical protein VN688_28740 [Gemmataceae bacterium]|nr:hypothetical protein [Gemmataceae bacterium]
MSMGMMVYLVDEAEVKAVPGSNDADLLEELLEQEGQGESLTWLDEEMEDLMEDWCPGFTHADALRDIFAGQVTRPDAGFVYKNAFEHVCSSFGQWVQNHFHRCSTELVTQLDELFAAHGVELRFWNGLVGRSPVPLPENPFGSSLGHWTGAEVRAAAPAFRAMRAAGPHGEDGFEEMLDEVGEWITKVEARPGSMLVAAYS